MNSCTHPYLLVLVYLTQYLGTVPLTTQAGKKTLSLYVESLSARCLAFHSQVSFSTHHHSTALLIKLSPLKLRDGQRDPQSPSHTIRPLGRDQDPTAQHTWQFLKVTFIDSLSPGPATSQQALDFHHRSTVGRLGVVLQETAFLAQKDAHESLGCVLAQAPVPQLSSEPNGQACLSVCHHACLGHNCFVRPLLSRRLSGRSTNHGQPWLARCAPFPSMQRESAPAISLEMIFRIIL